jgi:hypothetical protein
MANMRKCIGSAKFGIEAHEAPIGDFPAQPSQKDGLGRMCKTHWNQYTSALRKAALARKASEAVPAEPEPVEAPEPIRTRAKRQRKTATPEAGSQGDAGWDARNQLTLGPRAPTRGPSPFGRAGGQHLGHRPTPAPCGARGPTWPRLAAAAGSGISRETRPRAHIWEARSSRSAEPACGDPRSPSPAPFVELHDRQSTAQLPMSNGAPPAASATTWSTVRSAAGWAPRW